MEGPIMKKVTLSYHEKKKPMRGLIRKYVQNRIGKSHPTTTYSTITISRVWWAEIHGRKSNTLQYEHQYEGY